MQIQTESQMMTRSMAKKMAAIEKSKMDLIDSVTGNIEIIEYDVRILEGINKGKMQNKISTYWASLEKYDSNTGNVFKLTEQDLDTIVMPESYTIEGSRTKLTFSNGPYTLDEMFGHILDVENIDRPKYADVLGFVDRYYVYFQGLYKNENGSYSVSWGT